MTETIKKYTLLITIETANIDWFSDVLQDCDDCLDDGESLTVNTITEELK